MTLLGYDHFRNVFVRNLLPAARFVFVVEIDRLFRTLSASALRGRDSILLGTQTSPHRSLVRWNRTRVSLTTEGVYLHDVQLDGKVGIELIPEYLNPWQWFFRPRVISEIS